MSLSLYLLWSYMLIGAYISGVERQASWGLCQGVLCTILWMWLGPIAYLWDCLCVVVKNAMAASRSL